MSEHQRHPLFPRADDCPESRDIRFVTFRRKRWGQVESLPVDFPADAIRSWPEVIARWGGGEYQAIGKDEARRIVACHPLTEWLLFDAETQPFTLRSGAPTRAPSPAEVPFSPPPPAPLPVEDLVPPIVALLLALLREFRAQGKLTRATLRALRGALLALFPVRGRTNTRSERHGRR